MSDVMMLRRLLSEDQCCASALVAMGLYWRQEENPALLSALHALCNGLNNGMLCGALTGGAILLGLLLPEQTAELSAEVTEWFKSHCLLHGSFVEPCGVIRIVYLLGWTLCHR